MLHSEEMFNIVTQTCLSSFVQKKKRFILNVDLKKEAILSVKFSGTVAFLFIVAKH